MAEVSKCLSKHSYGNSCDINCVSFESYSDFIIHLSFDEGKELMSCWEDYQEIRSDENSTEEDIRSSLECLWGNIIHYTEPLSIRKFLSDAVKKAKNFFVAKLSKFSQGTGKKSGNNCAPCFDEKENATK